MNLTGNRICSRRKELGLTQEQLAEKCHMSRSQICRIENGETQPTADFLSKIAEVLDMKTSRLLPDPPRPSVLPDSEVRKTMDVLKQYDADRLHLLLSIDDYIRQSADHFYQGGNSMSPIELSDEMQKRDIRAEFYGLRISFPRKGFTENSLTVLRQMLQSKELLIRKAFCADSVEFTVTDDRILFPWFTRIPAGSDLDPIIRFLHALCIRAKSGKPAPLLKDYESEKYTFNKLLTAIGLGDSEYQSLRRQLMKNLTGPVPFPDRKSEMLHRERERQNRKSRGGSVLNTGAKWVPEDEAGDDDDEI